MIFAMSMFALLGTMLTIVVTGTITAFGALCIFAFYGSILLIFIITIKVDVSLQTLMVCFLLSFVFLAVSIAFTFSDVEKKPGKHDYRYRYTTLRS